VPGLWHAEFSNEEWLIFRLEGPDFPIPRWHFVHYRKSLFALTRRAADVTIDEIALAVFRKHAFNEEYPWTLMTST
jgi:hypothetical protein